MAELVYVDEQTSQANEVVRSAVTSGYFREHEVAAMQPEPTLAATIESILPHHCRALIADYRLSEHMAEVEFNGVELVRAYQQRFHRFPCFVATSFAGEAIQESIDTNIIFPKSDFLLARGSGGSLDTELPFFHRVRRKVDEYGSYVEATVAEFNRLAEANEHGKLTAQQVERLVELDALVEALRGKSAVVPRHLKGKPLIAFGHLVDRAEALAERVRRELGEGS